MVAMRRPVSHTSELYIFSSWRSDCGYLPTFYRDAHSYMVYRVTEQYIHATMKCPAATSKLYRLLIFREREGKQSECVSKRASKR